MQRYTLDSRQLTFSKTEKKERKFVWVFISPVRSFCCNSVRVKEIWMYVYKHGLYSFTAEAVTLGQQQLRNRREPRNPEQVAM